MQPFETRFGKGMQQEVTGMHVIGTGGVAAAWLSSLLGRHAVKLQCAAAAT